MELTAATLLETLRSRAGDVPHRHYHGAGGVLGVPMRAVFDTARAFTDLPLPEVARLLEVPEYEPRLAAFSVLDFRARRAALPEAERRSGYELYLRRHDRIDNWDIVDRAAPQVVGRYLLDRSRDPLFELARSADPLRRRTAMTAPLYFARYGRLDDLADLFGLAELLLEDPDPVVSKPVGIALKYAGVRDEQALRNFLDKHAGGMQRAALRYAVEKLPPAIRGAYLSG